MAGLLLLLPRVLLLRGLLEQLLVLRQQQFERCVEQLLGSIWHGGVVTRRFLRFHRRVVELSYQPLLFEFDAYVPLFVVLLLT